MPLPAIVPIAVGALGQMFGALGANKQAKAQQRMSRESLAEQRRQFDASHALDVGRAGREQGDYDLRRSSIAATSPQRQQIMAALMSRFGLGGGAPRPGGMPMAAPSPQATMPATAGPPQGNDPSEMLRLLMARFNGGGA